MTYCRDISELSTFHKLSLQFLCIYSSYTYISCHQTGLCQSRRLCPLPGWLPCSLLSRERDTLSPQLLSYSRRSYNQR